MTTLRQQVAANRKRILAREAAIAGMLAAAFQHAQRTIQPTQQAVLSAYSAELDALQADDDEEDDSGPLIPPTVPLIWTQQSGHGPKLERTVLLALASFALTSRMHITDGQRQAVLQGATDAQALVRTALQPLTLHLSMEMVDGLAKGAPKGVLDALIGKSLTTGNPLSTLLDRLGEPTAAKVMQTLQAALTAGAHPTVAARMLTNATGMAYNRALTISRTELISAYRRANIDTFRASSDVVDGWIWTAAPGACPFCQSMDGTFHTLDEYLDSHPNCRCTPRPHTKPLAEILSQFAA